VRGWRYVGRLGQPVEEVLADVPPDSILAYSSSEEGPLRCGTVRARVTTEAPYYYWPVTGVALGDYVFVATALGEHAFRPSAPATTE